VKAIQLASYGPPTVLEPVEVATPSIAPRDVLIEVKACGVCGHDVLSRRGAIRRNMKLPVIPGHEVAGVVVEVGLEVFGIEVGQRVASTQRAEVCGQCELCRTGRETLCERSRFLGHEVDGGYAELVRVAADTVCVVPDTVSDADAAVAACAVGTGYNAVVTVGKVQLGERVLVVGAAGGVGIHAVQLAKAAGTVVVGVVRREAQAAIVRSNGADDVVVAPTGAFGHDLFNRFGGIDVAIDTVGAATFNEIRRAMARGGRIVLVGELGTTPVDINLATVFRRGLSLLSAVSTTRVQLARTLDLIAAGLIRPVVADTLPLHEASRAHELVESGASGGRVVLLP
jgi:acryloyl-coenzyme A reductase